MIATGVPNFVGQPAVDQLKRWMSSLDTIRQAILNSIYSQLRDLGCQQKGIDALRKQVFGK
jgi:hypothetical protein